MSRENYQMKYIWDPERHGLSDLNKMLKDDKTQRLGMAVITEKQVYTIQSVDQKKVQLRAAFFEVPPPNPK